MKSFIRILAFIAAFAVAAPVFQNCAKVQPEEPLPEGRISAGIEANPAATRTTLGEGNFVLWQEGDHISVLRPANYEFTLASGAGSRSAEFSGTDFDKTSGYWALYPYNIGAVTLENDTRVAIPWSGTPQTAVKGSFDPALALMLGFSTSESVSFRQVLSYIKFTTDFPCTSVRFSASGDVVATKLTVEMDGDGNPEIISTEGGSSVVTLSGGGSRIEPGTYLIAVLPTTLSSGFNISFETAEGNIYDVYKSTSRSVTLKRAGILDLGTFHASDYAIPSEWRGEGTALHPYLISTKDHLTLLQTRLGTTGTEAEAYAAANYYLTGDIDCEGATLALGGVQQFKGTFDGGGNSITNIRPGTYFSSSGYGDHTDGYCTFTALFPRLHNATLKNLGVVMDNSFYSMSSSYNYAIYGGIAGYATSSTGSSTTITNCSFSVGTKKVSEDELVINGNGYTVWGGIVGDNGGHLNCYGCTADIKVRIMPDYNYDSSTHAAGGIIGKIESETKNTENFDITVRIDRCRSLGRVAMQGMKKGDAITGGIIGYVYEAYGTNDTNLKMSNCANEAEITASGNNLDGDAFSGGLVGKLDSDGGADLPWIYNSLNKGYVKAFAKASYSGGIMGWCYSGFISTNTTTAVNCANTGEIVNGNAAEGISGGSASDFSANSNGTFTGCKKRSDSPTASTMNSGRSGIPSVSGLVYAEWTGSGTSLNLEF